MKRSPRGVLYWRFLLKLLEMLVVRFCLSSVSVCGLGGECHGLSRNVGLIESRSGHTGKGGGGQGQDYL